MTHTCLAVATMIDFKWNTKFQLEGHSTDTMWCYQICLCNFFYNVILWECFLESHWQFTGSFVAQSVQKRQTLLFSGCTFSLTFNMCPRDCASILCKIWQPVQIWLYNWFRAASVVNIIDGGIIYSEWDAMNCQFRRKDQVENFLSQQISSTIG